MTSSPRLGPPVSASVSSDPFGCPGPPIPDSAGKTPAMGPGSCRLFSQQALPSLQRLHPAFIASDLGELSGLGPAPCRTSGGQGVNCSVLTELCRLAVLSPIQGPVSQGPGCSVISGGMETARTEGAVRGCDSSYTVLSICPPGLGHEDLSFLGINPLEGTIKLFFFFSLCDCFWGCSFRLSGLTFTPPGLPLATWKPGFRLHQLHC